MAVYYNEIDPFCVDWLRNLIAAGHLPAGDVDERSIEEVSPDDLRGYAQCHFFAGLGGWPHALDLADWPRDRPCWTGSCPCQSLSGAGRRQGHADARHLWPALFRLLAERRPPAFFGEQVASALGREWLAAVRLDLEALGYAVGAADLPAACSGAPHIRQRLLIVAHAGRAGSSQQQRRRDEPAGPAANGRDGPLADGASERWDRPELARAPGATASLCDEADQRGAAGLRQPAGRGAVVGLDDGLVAGLEGHGRPETPNRGDDGVRAEARPVAASGRPRALAYADLDQQRPGRGPGGEGGPGDGAGVDAGGCGQAGGVADAVRDRAGAGGEPPAEHEDPGGTRGRGGAEPGDDGLNRWPGAVHGGWDDADWLLCRDGKWRPVEPGTFPLAHGIPARVGQLRAYGNAIEPKAASEFVRACREVIG